MKRSRLLAAGLVALMFAAIEFFIIPGIGLIIGVAAVVLIISAMFRGRPRTTRR